jgi:hypothetical protein
MEEALGVAHYPHVRAMVESRFRRAMDRKMKIPKKSLPDVEALVVKAFCGKNMTRSQLSLSARRRGYRWACHAGKPRGLSCGGNDR